jgi:hypothetical protein
MSPHAPVRSYFKPEIRPHRFTHHPDEIEAGLFSVALVVADRLKTARRPAVSGLAAL